MKRQLNSEEIEMLRRELFDLGFDSLASIIDTDNLYMNGITIIGVNETGYGPQIRYVEDDLNDEKGNPYLFEYPAKNFPGEVMVGKRAMAVYVVGRYYYLIPTNGETFILTGASDREKAESIDISKSIKLPDPRVLDLPKDPPREITEEDVKDIKAAVKQNGNFKAKGILGTIAMSLLFVIVIGLIYIFAVTAISSAVGSGVGSIIAVVGLVIALAGIIGGIVFSILFFKNIYLRRVMKMRYIKTVMFIGLTEQNITQPGDFAEIHIYEWIGNEVKFTRCERNFATTFLPKDVRYGDFISMLTKDANQRTKGNFAHGMFCALRKENE